MKSKSPKSGEKELRPTAARVLKEFMADVEAVGIEKVGAEWPDLAITYCKARQAVARPKEKAK